MKTIEESVAAAMDVQRDTAIVPFLPYIFQDCWETRNPSRSCAKNDSESL